MTLKSQSPLLAMILACCLSWVGPPVATAAELQPIENFTKWPLISSVVVSPSGKRLAMVVPGGGDKGYRRLAVMDLEALDKKPVVGDIVDADIYAPRWINDNRLVFEAYERGLVVKGGGTFAVNHDGSGLRQLIAWTEDMAGASSILTMAKTLPYGWSAGGGYDDGSDDVFVYRFERDNRGDVRRIEAARMNTVTAERRNLGQDMPANTQSWILDANQQPRMVTTYRDGRVRIFWRATGSDRWDEVASFDDVTEAGFRPWHIEGTDTVLVESRLDGDTTGIYKFDPATRKILPEPLIKVSGFDMNAVAEIDSKTHRLLGVHFKTDRNATYWFDDDLDRLQQSIDKSLPSGRVNRLHCGRCATSRYIVVESSSDRQPGEYFLFDRTRNSLSRIGESAPWINEKSQAQRSFHLYTARDGLSLPAYVTHPVGSTPDQALPTVVLVHGGPWVRGSDLGWDGEAQFLASRGYRVLQPEFRGSTGYGDRLYKAGFKQWGLAMQDDLADVVAWAASRKLTDASRVCVVGGSYGGYAALMAPIRDPGVYRCAASLAGVTDINLMYDITWSDLGDTYRRIGMPVMIGDQDKDAKQLAAASPLNRVAEIKVPVLLAHGALDRRVPVDHARKFVSAAKSAGVQIEQVIYPEEGHGFSLPEDRTDFYRRLETFLARSLKPAP